MNIDYLIKKLLGRSPCTLDKTARLYPGARLHNARGLDGKISIGAHSIIRGELTVFGDRAELAIGSWCYVGDGAKIWSVKRITIGNRVLVSHNVSIFDSQTHPLNPYNRHKQFRDILTTGHPGTLDLGQEDVVIDDDVWVGCNSVVLRGVHLNEGCVIGAGSVVTKSIPAFALAAGNPARIIRMLSDEERSGNSAKLM